nr:MAG TPA: hypothetical protein [Caudoviricetes sp.]
MSAFEYLYRGVKDRKRDKKRVTRIDGERTGLKFTINLYYRVA